MGLPRLRLLGMQSFEGRRIRVRAGTLDDTSWLRPARHIWTRSKQPWITFAEGDQIFEAQPLA